MGDSVLSFEARPNDDAVFGLLPSWQAVFNGLTRNPAVPCPAVAMSPIRAYTSPPAVGGPIHSGPGGGGSASPGDSLIKTRPDHVPVR